MINKVILNATNSVKHKPLTQLKYPSDTQMGIYGCYSYHIYYIASDFNTVSIIFLLLIIANLDQFVK